MRTKLDNLKSILLRSAWSMYTRLACALSPYVKMGGRVDYLTRRFVAFANRGKAVTLPWGHRMCFPPDDISVVSFLSGIYKEDTTRLFKDLVQTGMTVVDLGAHVGYYSLLAAYKVGPTGKVYAFEPNPHSYTCLLSNVHMNGCHNIVAVPKAVSNCTSTMTLFLCREAMCNSLYGRSKRLNLRTVEVDVTTLDEYFGQAGWPQVDVVKMNIEGAEKLALEGMVELMRRNPIMKLIIEFFPPNLQAAQVSEEEFMATLLKYGFTKISPIFKELETVDIADLTRLMCMARGGPVNLLCQRE